MSAHLNEQHVREQIEANIDEELCLFGHNVQAFKAATLRDIIHILSLCDEK
jgi:hypothetical protein